MSGKKSSSAPVDKDIYLFLVEADPSKGVCEEYQFLLNKLLADKIFSESADEVCVRGLDKVKNLKFEQTTWDTVRKFSEETANRPQQNSSNSFSSVLAGCKAISDRARGDNYSALKVLCFGNFSEYKIQESELQKLKAIVEAEGILLTIVFPKEVSCMSSVQQKNFDSFTSVLGTSEDVFIFTFEKCLGRILNRVANKSKRSMPWKVVLDIADTIQIPVKKLIINRKNTTSFKTERKESRQKETVWTTNDGTAVDETDISTAFVYGDQIVSTGEASSNETGDACLKLLVFCPRENIQPAYLVGDGTDIFLAEEDEQGSYVKLDALIKVLHKTNTVAVVRKVWRKNAAAHIGVLVPDLERKGLIYTDLCFADDISTPFFPPLIKETTSETSVAAGKDSIIDELIAMKSIPNFFPEEGPVDPAELIVRQHVTRKLGSKSDPGEEDSTEIKPKKPYDSLELFFEGVILSKDLVEKFKDAFALTPVKMRETERPSGLQVFRKRGGDADIKNGVKKLKVEDNEAEAIADEEEAQDAEDMDDLLNDL